MAMSQEGTQARFQPTHWSIVLQAGDTSNPAAHDALSELCQTYWFPLYAFIRGQGKDCHEAKDLTQGFFLHLLQKNLIKQVDRERGKFRSFLLACLTNFMKDEWRKENANKRGGCATLVSINEEEAEERYGRLPASEPDSASKFDQAWAATVIENAKASLRKSYAERGRLEVYESLKPYLSGQLAPEAYPEVARKLGMTKGTLEANLSRFKDSFAKHVRQEVAKIVGGPAEIDGEIRYLMSAWVAE